jgi:hypothetical protein
MLVRLGKRAWLHCGDCRHSIMIEPHELAFLLEPTQRIRWLARHQYGRRGRAKYADIPGALVAARPDQGKTYSVAVKRTATISIAPMTNWKRWYSSLRLLMETSQFYVRQVPHRCVVGYLHARSQTYPTTILTAPEVAQTA